MNRGLKRALLSIVVDIADGEEPREDFSEATGLQLQQDQGGAIAELLRRSGLWNGLRTRPFAKIPAPHSRPRVLFVTAIDTEPHAPDPTVVAAGCEEVFATGLRALLALGEFPVYVCTGANWQLPLPEHPRLRAEQFSGPHPAGLASTHMHLLAPVGPGRSNWHIGYQDVIAIGRLFSEGILSTERIISLAGPTATCPRLIRTRLGAATADLTAGECTAAHTRVVSGSAISGRRADNGQLAWLGRYHNQISLLPEGGPARFLSWLQPGARRYSKLGVFVSSLLGAQQFPMNTLCNGGERALLPVGVYEAVMPLDILATPLLRALITSDMESVAALGGLELAEEDLALCSFVCPSKYEFGAILRTALNRIEVEG